MTTPNDPTPTTTPTMLLDVLPAVVALDDLQDAELRHVLQRLYAVNLGEDDLNPYSHDITTWLMSLPDEVQRAIVRYDLNAVLRGLDAEAEYYEGAHLTLADARRILTELGERAEGHRILGCEGWANYWQCGCLIGSVSSVIGGWESTSRLETLFDDIRRLSSYRNPDSRYDMLATEHLIWRLTPNEMRAVPHPSGWPQGPAERRVSANVAAAAAEYIEILDGLDAVRRLAPVGESAPTPAQEA